MDDATRAGRARSIAPPSGAMIRLLLLGSALALVRRRRPPASQPPHVPHAASAEARTRTALERIEALNPRLNAVIAVDPTALDQARALDRIRRARGPLFGMPILIKDNIETAGPLPTTAGSLALADNVTGRDAPLVARLRAAGAVIVGKANLSRMGEHPLDRFDLGLERARRPGAQPYALNRNPCGSSSGSAVGGRRGHGAGRDRHRDRRLDHLPGGDQRHRRLQAQRRPGQPHPCRADQPQPGHARADDPDGARRRFGDERDRRQRPRRSRHRRGRRAGARIMSPALRPTRCAACASA